MDRIRSLTATKVFIPLVGSHDINPGINPGINPDMIDEESLNPYHYVEYYFGITSKEPYRAFSAGDSKLFFLDSNLITKATEWQNQLKWFRDELDLSDSRWNFVFSHDPIVNVGMLHATEQFKFWHVADFFGDAIDWHFSGHEHLYQRSRPLTYSNGFFVSHERYSDGVGYMILPPAGTSVLNHPVIQDSKLRDLFARPVPVPLDVHTPQRTGFAAVHVLENELEIVVYGKDVDAPHTFQILDYVRYKK